MNYTFNSMKKIPLIALLIFGCAGNLASKEETLLNENFSIPNKNQNELFNMCIQWISIPENNLNITKFEKTRITGTGIYMPMQENDTLLKSKQIIEFVFNIQIDENNINIIYSDYVYLSSGTGKNNVLVDSDLDKTTLYLQKFTQSFKKHILNTK